MVGEGRLRVRVCANPGTWTQQSELDGGAKPVIYYCPAADHKRLRALVIYDVITPLPGQRLKEIRARIVGGRCRRGYG